MLHKACSGPADPGRAADLDGSISTSELGRIFRSLGQNATEEEVQHVISKYDTDKSGKVEFEGASRTREFVRRTNPRLTALATARVCR